MRPRKTEKSGSGDLFRARLDQIINMRHELVRLTDFERRQMKALRAELDHQFEAQSGLAKQPSKDNVPNNLSNTSRSRPSTGETRSMAIPVNCVSFLLNFAATKNRLTDRSTFPGPQRFDPPSLISGAHRRDFPTGLRSAGSRNLPPPSPDTPPAHFRTGESLVMEPVSATAPIEICPRLFPSIGVVAEPAVTE